MVQHMALANVLSYGSILSSSVTFMLIVFFSEQIERYFLESYFQAVMLSKDSNKFQ